MTIYIYFILIFFSIIGYGFTANKFLKLNINNFGNFGILGIICLSLISYSTSFLINHGYYFNSLILIFGIIFFLQNINFIANKKKQIYLSLSIILFLILFISIGKNHDDFPYYHFPYTAILTEFSHPIGLGQLNNGFRSPSSLFFINSLFFLPGLQYYGFHFAAAYIFCFANIVLINLVFKNKFFVREKFINFLSLLIFIYINIFFYRLAEHGTDRSGMILTMISLVYFFLILLDRDKIDNQNLNNHLKLFIIYLCFIFTIKPFFIINFIFFIILFFNKRLRVETINLFFSKIIYFSLFLVSFTIFYTFINSGCLIFPLSITCFENLSWSIDKKHINEVSQWFELWSKNGASPNFEIEDKKIYLENFNWLSNWIDNYFFNKVSDYLLGLTFMVFTVSGFFLKYQSDSIKKFDKFLISYLLIILLFLEWFLRHPALRYGGYHLIALIFIIPICFRLSKKKINFKEFSKKTLFLVILTCIIFLSRNLVRINNEYKLYSYNLLKDPKYLFMEKNKDYYLRHNIQIRNNINDSNTEFFLGKKIFTTNLN
ncbi:hypothetical protein OAL74_01960 [Candidatus Pelagibacter sp.]|nr:hypothetical protein [Candidatus Pelagibacter sp.]